MHVHIDVSSLHCICVASWHFRLLQRSRIIATTIHCLQPTRALLQRPPTGSHHQGLRDHAVLQGGQRRWQALQGKQHRAGKPSRMTHLCSAYQASSDILNQPPTRTLMP